MILRVLTFNVQHFENFNTDEIDFDAFAKAIKDINPDIIGMNEIRGLGSREDYQAQTEIMAEKLGYFGFFAKATEIGKGNPYGNAILSRFPIISAEVIPIPDPEVKSYDDYYETRCLLKAKLDVSGGLDVFVSHFGLNPDEHERADKTVCANVGGRCIFMGDLNVTPESHVLDGLRSILTDTANENDAMFTFPSNKPDRKIDYIFIGDGIKKISASVVPVVVSDHRPYLAELEIL